MANFTGAQRTNYVMFKPEKLSEVQEYLGQFEIELSPHSTRPEFHCLLASQYSSEGVFSTWSKDENGAVIGLEMGWVAEQMMEGQVLVVMLAGHEKLRYIIGSAGAWNSKGESIFLSLSDIYTKAAEAFQVDESSITACNY